MKEESEKASLKLNIQKTKIMPSGSITSWDVDEEKVEAVTDFLFLASKITADGDFSHEIKRHLLLGRKAVTNLDNILKSRVITSPTNVGTVKAMVFPGVMYGCESWTIKKPEHLKKWCFQIVVLEKTLESPLDCRFLDCSRILDCKEIKSIISKTRMEKTHGNIWSVHKRADFNWWS